MSKQVLILLHGMGEHTAESFKKEVIRGANNALGRYTSYKDKKFEDEVNIHSISYDEIFEKHRQALKDSGNGLRAFISGQLGDASPPNIIEEVARIDANLGEDKFLYTHILDIVFYVMLIGEEVRLHITKEILKKINKYPESTKINILAHSLGTAVLHDSLNKLYTKGPSTDKQLNVKRHQVQSIWMFANVSHVVTSFTGLESPFDSLVNPGPDGCCVEFYNIFHQLDPIVKIKRFDPDNINPRWIDPGYFEDGYYRIETKKVSRANPHSIEGYMEDPDVCYLFLNHFLEDGFDPPDPEKTTGNNAFKHIEGEAIKIKESFNGFNTTDDFLGWLKMVNAYINYLKKLKEDGI